MNQPRGTLAAGMEVTPSVRLVSPIGAGGMGAVWLADHTALNTRVVVKFMLGGLDSSTSARARFKREAEAASQVKSPHVVQTFDYGVTSDGVPFIVMEHLEGRDLGQEILAKGRLDPARVVAIIAQVAKALTRAHAASVLHRDIKPDNIFLCNQDGDDELFVKLLDFGIAKSRSAEGQEITLDGQTKTGQVVGTPFYMSPEQVTAQKIIDLRSDLWSLGIVAFEALTAKRPFDGPSFGALAVKIATGDAPKPSDVNPDLPATVDEWFGKACAREPQQRFSSARELSDAFRAAFEGVVSLPPIHSGGMSDSGPRGSGSGPREQSLGSTPQPSVSPGPIAVDHDAHARPSFVLASTIEGAPLASGEHALLAVAIGGEDRAKRTLPLRVLGAVLAVVISAVILGVGIGKSSKDPPADSGVAAASAPPSAAMDRVAPTLKATASETAVPAAAPSALVPVLEAATPRVTRHAPITAVPLRPPARPTASVAPRTSAIASAAPTTRPPPNDAGRHNDPLF